ncbi:hypothetical protein [Salana multivorans]
MTEPRIRYWRHVNRPEVIDWAYADSAGTVEFFTGSPYWVEVTVTPVVTGDVIEQAARVISQQHWNTRPVMGEPLGIQRRLARALADAGLLAGSRTVTPADQIEKGEGHD